MAEKNPRIADVAKYAGVGVGTVSRVLNQDAHVHEDTRAKVLAAMAELQYKPNTFARGLKSRNSKTLGVFVADIINPLLAKIIRVIEETLQETGYGLLMFDTNMKEERVEKCIDIVEDKMLDGLFILGEHIQNEKQLNRLIALGIPVVTVTMQIPMTGTGLPDHFASITINNERAAYSATDYLCSSGAKNIALIMSPEDDENVGAARYAGYCKALQHRGYQLDKRLICTNDRLSLKNGYDSVMKLLERKVPFDAIFAMSDLSALGAMRALKENGIRVPDDVSVIGFDGIEEGEYSVPSLTTIDQPRHLMATESARIMMDLIRKKDVSRREIIMDYEFIIRESTK